MATNDSKTKTTNTTPFPTDYVEACRVSSARELTSEEASALDRMGDTFWGVQLALRSGALALVRRSIKLMERAEKAKSPADVEVAEAELEEASLTFGLADHLRAEHDRRARVWLALEAEEGAPADQ